MQQHQPFAPPPSFNWRQAVITSVGFFSAGAALMYAAKASDEKDINAYPYILDTNSKMYVAGCRYTWIPISICRRAKVYAKTQKPWKRESKKPVMPWIKFLYPRMI